jgi:tetratricopeptide (TPR) repeat protein
MVSPEETMFHEAMSAVEAGERARARDLFTRLLKIRQDNPEYWLWMSSIVETQRERQYCLNEVIRLDPKNAAARRGLMIAGVMDADETQVVPRKIQQRNWESVLLGGETPEKALAASSLRLTIALAVGLVVLIGIVVVGVLAANRPTYGVVYVTEEPTAKVSVTPEPTASVGPLAKGPTATPAGPAALSALLKATYTPTPLYVNTPHAISEAYRIAMRAYARSEWESVKQNMVQVVTAQPEAADLLFYIGEADRFQKNYTEALSFYNQALAVNANFAPAYLGRARVKLAVDPSARKEPLADLQMAIQKDPAYGEAYLSLSAILIDDGKYQDAMDQLKLGENALNGSPLLAMYRAQALVGLGKPEEAIQQAQLANKADITLLPVYRTLAEAYLANQQTPAALEALSTYLAYVKDDAAAYVMQAGAYQVNGNVDAALKAYDLALAIDKNLTDIYQNRGTLHYQRQEYDLALTDFQTALRNDKKNYAVSMMLGKAFFQTGVYGNAYNQFEICNGLATTPQQKAEVLYWRGQSLELLNYIEPALRDYKALMLLKPDVADPAWISLAATKAVSLVTPTRTPVTPTVTNTRMPTATVTPSRTPAPTQTRVPSSTVTPSRTSSPTATPTQTASPTKTATSKP